MHTHPVIALSLVVRPFLGQWTTTVVASIQAIVLIGYLLCLRLSAAMTDDLERLIGTAVLDALERIHLPVKGAAALMAMDYHHLQQALKHEPGRHLSIYKLARLPFTFWLNFLPALSALVVRQHLKEIAEDLNIRRSA